MEQISEAPEDRVCVLLENVMLRTLRSVYSSPHQKILVIQELESWFDMQPQVLVEIFLNYDNDQTVATVAHNALFNDLCSLLCDIAEDGNAPGVDTDEQETLQMWLCKWSIWSTIKSIEKAFET